MVELYQALNGKSSLITIRSMSRGIFPIAFVRLTKVLWPGVLTLEKLAVPTSLKEADERETFMGTAEGFWTVKVALEEVPPWTFPANQLSSGLPEKEAREIVLRPS